MHVLITRPRHAALITAGKLQALGHETSLAPVLEMQPLPVQWPKLSWAGLPAAFVATSSHAFLQKFPAPWYALRLFVVGEQTAQAARDAGFVHVQPPQQTAADLATLLGTVDRAKIGSSPMVYLAGKYRKPDLEIAWPDLVALEVYQALAQNGLPAPVLNSLRAGDIDAVLHYSHRSAEVFLALADAAALDLTGANLIHFCLSSDVAMPLKKRGLATRIAATPDEAGILAAI